MRYDYKGAAALWDRIYLLCFNPWDFSDRQNDRRFFMREITRGNKQDIIEYINFYIDDQKEEPATDANAETIKELESLLYDIINYKGVIK